MWVRLVDTKEVKDIISSLRTPDLDVHTINNRDRTNVWSAETFCQHPLIQSWLLFISLH